MNKIVSWRSMDDAAQESGFGVSSCEDDADNSKETLKEVVADEHASEVPNSCPENKSENKCIDEAKHSIDSGEEGREEAALTEVSQGDTAKSAESNVSYYCAVPEGAGEFERLVHSMVEALDPVWEGEDYGKATIDISSIDRNEIIFVIKHAVQVEELDFFRLKMKIYEVQRCALEKMYEEKEKRAINGGREISRLLCPNLDSLLDFANDMYEKSIGR